MIIFCILYIIVGIFVCYYLFIENTLSISVKILLIVMIFTIIYVNMATIFFLKQDMKIQKYDILLEVFKTMEEIEICKQKYMES